MKKLRNERGETLVELMVSVLVVALSVALMLGCVLFSSKADENAEERDQAHYAALTAADAPGPTANPVNGATAVNVTITRTGAPNATLEVNVYGDANGGLYSYRRK